MTEPTYGTTPAGAPITDALVTELAAEAAAGYPTAALRPRRRGRPTIDADGDAADPLAVRLDKRLRAALEARSKADHVTAAETVRRALHRYLRAS